MDADPPVPLVMLDDIGGVTPSVLSAVRAELAGGAEVIVVMSRRMDGPRWQRLLLRGTVDRLTDGLDALPGARVILLGVSPE